MRSTIPAGACRPWAGVEERLAAGDGPRRARSSRAEAGKTRAKCREQRGLPASAWPAAGVAAALLTRKQGPVWQPGRAVTRRRTRLRQK